MQFTDNQTLLHRDREREREGSSPSPKTLARPPQNPNPSNPITLRKLNPRLSLVAPRPSSNGARRGEEPGRVEEAEAGVVLHGEGRRRAQVEGRYEAPYEGLGEAAQTSFREVD